MSRKSILSLVDEGELSEKTILARIAEEEQLAKEHARKAEGWRLILRGQRYLSGDVAGAVLDEQSPNGDKPSHKEAVLRIVASDPTHPWKAAEIMEALKERGWMFGGKTPQKTLGAVLSILTTNGELTRPDRGVYKLRLEDG